VSRSISIGPSFLETKLRNFCSLFNFLCAAGA
jgi:hypothetical protein